MIRRLGGLLLASTRESRQKLSISNIEGIFTYRPPTGKSLLTLLRPATPGVKN